MPFSFTDRQIFRMRTRWFKDVATFTKIEGRGSDDFENETEIGPYQCFYLGTSRSTLGSDRQAQNYDSLLYVSLDVPFNDRNARYKVSVTVYKSKREMEDRNGPPEPLKTVLLEPVQIDEYTDNDSQGVFLICRCQNAKD